MRLEQRPLIAMELTLMDYRKFSTEGAYKKLCQLYNRSNSVRVDFIILWYNNEVIRTKNCLRTYIVNF